eukprot:12404953-Karenia_brevis.AAC.1
MVRQNLSKAGRKVAKERVWQKATTYSYGIATTNTSVQLTTTAGDAHLALTAATLTFVITPFQTDE